MAKKKHLHRRRPTRKGHQPLLNAATLEHALHDPVSEGVADTSQGPNSWQVLRTLERQRDEALAHLNRRANARKTLEVLDQYLVKVEEAVRRLGTVEKLVAATLRAVHQYEGDED